MWLQNSYIQFKINQEALQSQNLGRKRNRNIYNIDYFALIRPIKDLKTRTYGQNYSNYPEPL